MTIRREKKSRKRRGYRVHGYGRTGQHRKSGSKGGIGKAGRKSGKHKYSWVLKYEPDYFGKHGFRNPNYVEKRSIDLLEITNLVDNLIVNNKIDKEDDFYKVDVSEYGYDKVLAGGTLKHKLKIISKEFSKKAEEKIRALGSIPILKNASA
jgi:large subunit ribosomal protein L15